MLRYMLKPARIKVFLSGHLVRGSVHLKNWLEAGYVRTYVALIRLPLHWLEAAESQVLHSAMMI